MQQGTDTPCYPHRDVISMPNMHLIAVPGEQTKKNRERIFEDIMWNFPGINGRQKVQIPAEQIKLNLYLDRGSDIGQHQRQRKKYYNQL